MKKFQLCILVAAALMVTACNKKKADTPVEQPPASTATQPVPAVAPQAPEPPVPAVVQSDAVAEQNGPVAFDISKIPVTSKDVGAFPFFTAPAGYHYNEPERYIKTFDRSFYAVSDKSYAVVEGKTLKVDIRHDEKVNFELLLIEKSYEKAIIDAGGIQVFSGNAQNAFDKVEHSEWQRYAGNSNLRSSGWSTRTYVIRTDSAEIWIAITIDNYNAYMTLTQKGELQQTVSQVKEGESSPESK